VNKVVMFLTWFEFFDMILTIYFYGWPEISGSENFGSYGACVGMITTNAFV